MFFSISSSVDKKAKEQISLPFSIKHDLEEKQSFELEIKNSWQFEWLTSDNVIWSVSVNMWVVTHVYIVQQDVFCYISLLNFFFLASLTSIPIYNFTLFWK